MLSTLCTLLVLGALQSGAHAFSTISDLQWQGGSAMELSAVADKNNDNSRASDGRILIAGAGILGISTAYYLAKRDVPVVLVDPVGIAQCASGKAGGFLAKTWRDGTPLEELQRLGFDLHQELANELNGTDYRRLTCAAVSVDEERIVQKPPSLKVKSVEWVDRAVIGSVSMGEKDSIAQVHPRKLCDAMWNFCEEKGSILKIGRVVNVALNEQKSKVHKVLLEDGTSLDVDKLVVACGPWSSEAKSWFSDVGMNLLPPITSVKCHSILIKAPKILNQAVFFESDGALGAGDLEVYPRIDGDAYVNGFQGEEGFIEEEPGREVVEQTAIRKLKEAMEVSSQLAGIDPHTEQVCYWPETPDGPLLGKVPSVSNAYIATGHSVWGILQGPPSGKAISELILDGKTSCLDLDKFRPDRFADIE